jgi:hypothetical protein
MNMSDCNRDILGNYSPARVKNAGGPILLWISNALGFRVILEQDEQLLAEARKRLPKTVGHRGLMQSKFGVIHISADALRLNGRKGGKTAQRLLGAKGRRERARLMAAARWSDPKARGIAARQARARWRRRKQAAGNGTVP